MEAILYQNKKLKTNLSKPLDNIRDLKQISIKQKYLNSRGIEHNADAFSHGLGGKVLGELSTYGTAATVSAGHLAPNYPQLIGFVVVGALLPEVELGVAPSADAFETQQRRVLVLVPQTALVAREDGFHVQSAGSLDSARGFLLRRSLHRFHNFADFRHICFLGLSYIGLNTESFPLYLIISL